MEQILAQARRPQLLARRAAQLLQENGALQARLEEVGNAQEQLREELERLCAPEHYPAVITDVERNGRMRVSMHIQGMSPVRAEVHPDVPIEQIRVGAQGYMSKSRNCLLEISTVKAEWREIGTFEERLEDGRIVVKYQEATRVLTLTDMLHDVPLAKGDRIGFHEGAGLAFARIPTARGDHLFAETPEDDFSELGGLEHQIRLLKRAIEFTFKFPEIARRFRLPAKRGILLEGPPGNGKTRMARCLASFIRQLTGQTCRFQSVVGSEDYSMWLGGTESRLKERFAAAREAAQDGPCVIFIDEIDALGRHRGTDHGSGAPDRILSTLLGLMDDVQKTLSNVVLIGATNRADSLDPGLTRPGRLDLKLTVPRPNRRAAATILRSYLAGGLPVAHDNLDELTAPLLSRVYSPRGEYAELVRVRFNDGRQVAVSAKELVSGAMFEHVVRQAAEEAAVREVETGQSSGVTREDLTNCLERELLSTAALLSPGNVKAYVHSIPHDAHPVEVTVQANRSGAYVRGV
jgi:proteasome ATPase